MFVSSIITACHPVIDTVFERCFVGLNDQFNSFVDVKAFCFQCIVLFNKHFDVTERCKGLSIVESC